MPRQSETATGRPESFEYQLLILQDLHRKKSEGLYYKEKGTIPPIRRLLLLFRSLPFVASCKIASGIEPLPSTL